MNGARVRRNEMLLWEAAAAVRRTPNEARVEKRQGFNVPATTKENGSFPHHMFKVMDGLLCRNAPKFGNDELNQVIKISKDYSEHCC